ncbi:MAG TPA: hypothetical protein PLH57_05235, partial [Oligoflexia bacterium]|nr:hypothetical protein [Oligoflexia bacterium]
KDFRKLVSTKSRFNRYFKQIEKALAARFGSSISLKRTFKLTAHSGGYIPAATVLTHSFSRVESAALFDALYRNKESLVFARFARAKPFFSIYRKNTRTERYNLGLLKRLQKNRHPSLLQAELTHVFSGCSASAVIAWTDDDHYDLVRLWYSSVLEWFTTL